MTNTDWRRINSAGTVAVIGKKGHVPVMRQFCEIGQHTALAFHPDRMVVQGGHQGRRAPVFHQEPMGDPFPDFLGQGLPLARRNDDNIRRQRITNSQFKIRVVRQDIKPPNQGGSIALAGRTGCRPVSTWPWHGWPRQNPRRRPTQ